MADDASSLLDAARLEAYSTPLDKIDVALEERFANDTMWPFFERLRREDPVHYCSESPFGPYWSVTTFNDIVTVETNHQVFSSDKRIGIYDNEENEDFEMPMFIAMDPPKHDRIKALFQAGFTPKRIAAHEGAIRKIVNAALTALSPEFEKLYARLGRPSIPPEKLLRALLLQAFYSVRSERQLMEQLDYNLLFRWFVGLSLDAVGSLRSR